MRASHSTAAARAHAAAAPIHLVGSVPLESAETVLRTCAATLDGLVRRLPDGETGPRLRWMGWMIPAFERTPGITFTDPPEGHYTPHQQAVWSGPSDTPVLARIGISDVALESYRTFAALKRSGAIAADVRLQVGIATPCSPALALVSEGSRAVIEPAFERQVLRELAEICDAVPHDELAIQWDVCCEVGLWCGHFPAYFPDVREGVVARIARAVDAVPDDVEVGVHLCYGDFGHAHFVQPDDLGVLTEMANAVAAVIRRPLTWLHMPVPVDRDDDRYFAPLRSLELVADTELYLGLIHASDGVEGALRRAHAAQRVVDGFGVSTECGFGRRSPGGVAALLDLHVAVAEALGLRARSPDALRCRHGG